jgi:hypothetical protein
MDAVGNPVVQGGHAPIQFVIDADAVRQRLRTSPVDFATGRFSVKDDDPEDKYGGWRLSGNLRRKESEERIVAPKGLRLDGIVKAIILEPITADWLHFHHAEADRSHLVGSGEEREFPFATPAERYDDGLNRISTDYGHDYTAVKSTAYHRIISLARRRGIPVIDRRSGK